MLMTPAQPAFHSGDYDPPTVTKSVPLREFLASTNRDPAWDTNQLSLFKTPPDRWTLYCAGDLSLASRSCVSVVGSRRASLEGQQRAERLARELVKCGVVVVSGLARGIDAAAHRSAIENSGSTIAVIGTPLSKASPVENAFLQQIIWHDHLLISPFPEGRPVLKGNFPDRNRIMAAVSDATVIVEAADDSGALHQAVACQRLGRWLFILKSVVDSQKWPERFLGKPNTAKLQRTEQIFDALGLQCASDTFADTGPRAT